MTTTTDNPIEAVRARLDNGRKWHKGTFGFYDDPDATVCLLGACYAVSDALFGEPLIYKVVGEQFPERTLGLGVVSIPKFNDHPDTTWADIELVLDKASIAWDEAVR